MQQEILSALLGLDIGRINTRASLFVISEGKYRLLDCGISSTSLGPELHLGTGVNAALQVLQQKSGHVIMKAEGGLVMPATAVGLGIDQVALTTSAGPRIRAVVLGLSEHGSLRAGYALAGSMMLALVGCFGLADLADGSSMVDALIRLRPDVVLLVGGEDAGAEAPVRRWVEVLRLAGALLPIQVKPTLIYAGNPSLENDIRRRLEPVLSLHIIPNIQPLLNEWDLVPAQNALEKEILRIWEDQVPGLADLTNLTQNLTGTNGFMFCRSTRYLNRTFKGSQRETDGRGILAVDLGGGSTTLSAGMDGRTGMVIEDVCIDIASEQIDALCKTVQQWAVTPVTLQEVQQYVIEQALHPAVVPENVKALSLSQAAARYRLQHATKQLSGNHPWFTLNASPTKAGHFEPVIASGAVLTQAPTPGQAMMILLDGLQPCGITTMVLDQNHLLPILGAAGEAQPVLPVHVLASDAFVNLGTVISPVSQAPAGKDILTVQVAVDDGKIYSVDITQGTLRRLVIPPGVSAVLELKPSRQTDIGFNGMGVGGSLKVTGGLLGVVIDARGRPLRLPDADESRVEQLRRWLWALGG